MKLRRFSSFMLALCLTVCVLSGVRAEAPAPTLEQIIIDACRYRQEADLSGLNISADAFQQTFDQLFAEGKLPWYTTNDYQYTYNTDTGVIFTFTPLSKPMEDSALTAYEEKAAQILDVCVKEGMQQWQIALAIHDYLIVNGAYDSTLEKNTPYDLLIEGTSVCAGYALAYQDLLQRAGIDCRYVISEPMEHAWNLVCIDGNWYHVDLTWDDPEPDTEGYVSHRYFLLTDQQIAEGDKPHHDWQTDITCTDTRFSDSFWKDVSSAVCFESSDVCYYSRTEDLLNRIYIHQESTGKETILYKEDSEYIDIGYGNYLYEHQGLTLREGRLWFCTMTRVFSMKTDGSDRQTHYQKTGNVHIFGFHAGEDALELTLNDHDGNSTKDTVSLSPTDSHKCTFTRTVIAPTEEAEGYTLSRCDCGLEAKSVPTPAIPPVSTPDPEKTITDIKDRVLNLFGGKLWIPGAAVVVLAGLAILLGKRKK